MLGDAAAAAGPACAMTGAGPSVLADAMLPTDPTVSPTDLRPANAMACCDTSIETFWATFLQVQRSTRAHPGPALDEPNDMSADNMCSAEVRGYTSALTRPRVTREGASRTQKEREVTLMKFG